jgi:hypothetical protein
MRGAIPQCFEPQEKEFKCFAGMVPMGRDRQDWIMNLQRREVRSTLRMKIIRLVARFFPAPATVASRATCRTEPRFRLQLASRKDRAAGRGNKSPGSPARVATVSLQSTSRSQQHVRTLLGSPPSGQVTARRVLRRRSLGCPQIHPPAVCSRLHPTLPWAPAGLGRRTERYDGKRDLHFQHAA